MRRTRRILAAFGTLQIGQPTEPAWALLRPAESGWWSPRCSEGQLPLTTAGGPGGTGLLDGVVCLALSAP